MARRFFDFDPPDRFVAGAVGHPGSRSFYLQARRENLLVSLGVNKSQLSVLAERVDDLLDEILRHGQTGVPALPPGDAEDTDPLETPIEEQFRVGAMSLAWDTRTERVVVECYSEDADIPIGVDLEDLSSAEGDVFRVTLSGPMARSFARRSLAIVAVGLPPCPFCGNTIDPGEGHICPRSNGYRR